MKQNYTSMNWTILSEKIQKFIFALLFLFSVSATLNAQCTVNIPYLEDFESASVPAVPTCTSIENVGAGNDWKTINTGSNQALYYLYSYTDDADAWFYTKGLNLTAGTNYRLKFKYSNGSYPYVEKLKVAIGNNANSTSMTTQLLNFPSISTSNIETGQMDFVVPTSGVYYIGFNIYSSADQNEFYVDDISVDLSPSCIEPASVIASNITTASADISWGASLSAPADGYAYYVSTTNTIPAVATGTVAAGVTTVPLSGLSDATDYYVWVKSLCGGTDTSLATNAVNFTTKCFATNIPYFEDFESVTTPALPMCTSNENVGTGNNWETDYYTSTVLAYAYSWTEDADAWFYTRGLNLTAGTSYRLKFDYTNDDDYLVEKLKVAIGQGANAAAMTTQLLDFPSISTLNIEQGLIDFTVPTSGVYYIGFNVYSDADQYYLYVDNISVDLSPSCIEPTNVTVSNITTASADLSWGASLSAPADGYAYYVSTTNTIPAVATGTVAAGVTTVPLSGLSDATDYYVWVKSLCGAGDSSAATNILSFKTPCFATNIPYLEDFESVTTPALPMCTSNENVGAGNNWETSTFNTKTLRYKYNFSNAANTWFYTKGLNLTAGTSYRLKFDYTNNDDFYVEKLKVAIGQGANAAAMTTQLLDFPSISTLNIEQGLIDFTVPTTGVYYLGFNAYSIADQYYLYVDNISVDLSPSCSEPMNLTSGATSTTTGKATWKKSISNPTIGYEYYYSSSNVAPTSTTTASGSTQPTDTTANFSGLTPSTTYYVWVRSMCNSSDTSAWSLSSSFYTGYCEPIDYAGDTYIDAVSSTGGLVNLSNMGSYTDSGTGYNDYYSSDSLKIMAGDTAILTVNTISYYGEAGVSVFVDWNNNLIFDANELLFSAGNDTGDFLPDGDNTIELAIPLTTTAGSYRMRIVVDGDVADPTACEFDGYAGEAEDYQLVVIPSCTAPVVNLGADTSICAGKTLVLDAGNVGLAYSWSTGASSKTITVSAAGNYIVTVKDGVCQTSDTIKVTIAPVPNVTISASKLIACPNDTITLTATGGTTYAWEDASTSAIRTVNPTQNTSYTVEGTTGNCKSTAAVSIVIKTTGCDTGVEDLNVTNVTVYPNPANMNVQIVGGELTHYYQSMTVVDMTGRTVITQVINSNEESINVSNLVNGIYFVNLQGKQNKTVKIEVRH